MHTHACIYIDAHAHASCIHKKMCMHAYTLEHTCTKHMHRTHAPRVGQPQDHTRGHTRAHMHRTHAQNTCS